jgi:hypothetical protein
MSWYGQLSQIYGHLSINRNKGGFVFEDIICAESRWKFALLVAVSLYGVSVYAILFC